MKLTSQWKAAVEPPKQQGVWDISLPRHLKETSQDHLFQSKLLQESLSCLESKDLVEEAYLRGSMYRGAADEHSDVDLFIVVNPDKVEDAHHAVHEYLANNMNIVMSCHDRTVEDYGGIGFMTISQDKNTGKLYQLDLYIAIKGEPRKASLDGIPRIHSKDPDYCWATGKNEEVRQNNLPEKTQDFLDKYSAGSSKEDRLELLFQEMLVTLYMAKKHLNRGETSRLMKDNHFTLAPVAQMLQVITGFEPAGYCPIYIGNKTVEVCKEHGDKELSEMAGRVETLFETSCNLDKFKETFEIGKTIFEKSCPERYKELEATAEIFKKSVLGVNDSGLGTANQNSPEFKPQ